MGDIHKEMAEQARRVSGSRRDLVAVGNVGLVEEADVHWSRHVGGCWMEELNTGCEGRLTWSKSPGKVESLSNAPKKSRGTIRKEGESCNTGEERIMFDYKTWMDAAQANEPHHEPQRTAVGFGGAAEGKRAIIGCPSAGLGTESPSRLTTAQEVD